MPRYISIYFYFCPTKGNPIPYEKSAIIIQDSDTYEDILSRLIHDRFLLPLDDPLSHYQMILQRYRCSHWHLLGWWNSVDCVPSGEPVFLREGQTLASTHIIDGVDPKLNMTVHHESNLHVSVRNEKHGYTEFFSSGRYHDVSVECYITLEVSYPPSKEKPSSTPPGLSEIISTIATTATSGLIITASVATIIQTLIVVQERWEKTHHTLNGSSSQRISRRQIIPWLYGRTGDVRNTNSSKHVPQSKGTDIYAIRLRMTDGKEHELQKWLSEPDELKNFIDVFLQPSSKLKPTEVVFVLRNRDIIVIDVTEGVQGNFQLDEMLKFLKIDSTQK